MTAAILSGVQRQSTTLAAVAALHIGVFLVVAGDRIEVVLSPTPGPVEILPPAPMPQAVPPPELPAPERFDPGPVEWPDFPLPTIADATVSPLPLPLPDEAAGPGSSGAGAEDYRPPSIAMRGDRLAALIATCYPSAARRRGEEGRARVRIVVGANGRASSWALAEGTGISRLDSALDCVVRRLQFEPGHRDGRAVDAEVQLPIVFRLR